MEGKRLSCGRDFTFSSDLNTSLSKAFSDGFDFVCMPIVNPRYKREFIEGPAVKRPGALTRSDMLLTSQDWSTLIVAKISPWLQLDSKHDVIRCNSEKAFKQELIFASHLSVPAILILLKGTECVNMARLINEHILRGHNHQYWMQIPLKSALDQCDDVIQGEGHLSGDEMEWKYDTWKWWNKLRTLCDTSKKIGLALEITADLPPSEIMDRWYGEPVKAAIISTSVFMTNKKGFPVLSKEHQKIIKRLFKLDVQMIVSGADRHPEKGIKTYQQYLDHLWQTQDPPDNISRFAKGYEDYLQCPLQPLMDNLESQTYEVFEKDPVKYSQYQKAVYSALVSKKKEDDSMIVLMVLGAGRGPLVTASLNAAQKAETRVFIYAVEKNPNAVVTLENLKYEMWGDQVTIVSTDMREWQAPEKADIIISELLGSFGDNELSPECLDGVTKFLKDDGISIPEQYTSYVSPLSSCKLWNEARLCKDLNKPPEAPFETPYVVRLRNVYLLDQPRPLFTFRHPNKGIADNNRYDELIFTVREDTVLHGFGGYFHCVLFGDITISIVPETHSPGMFSWFPMFFPIKEPLHLKAGDRLKLHFWRVATDKNVWYEWCITEPRVCPIHNPKDPHIHGLPLPTMPHEARIIQYADDSTLVLTDFDSAKKVFLLCELYGMASGACINKEKSRVISKRARRNNNTTRYYRRKSNAIERGLSRRSHNLWIRRGLHHSINTNQSRDYPTTPPQGRFVRSSTDQRYNVQLYPTSADCKTTKPGV
ncbi:hypothetical protein LSH36_216g04041 [Paralvinella palmiformis]|uniref:Protein arginine N-methyltransferase 5 n=1 Tax=Paralvinella palmiformis TaxID=53620 RepID=A0AAD9JNJ8_9ANNE|nr:hypothetical protein LSH36_216g04041 [Paralvinella palmiformis]